MTELPQWAVDKARLIADDLERQHLLDDDAKPHCWLKDSGVSVIARALAEAAPGWTPLAEYKLPDAFASAPHMWCYHAEKKWMRMGVYYGELGRWYYSGTNELSQWSAQPGDDPTHVMPLPAAPEVG